MAPRAQGLQYANAEARFRDIVEIAGAALSFGGPLNEDTTSSGLTLDFAEGTATMVCPPGRPGQSGRRETYIGIEAGPPKRAPGRSGVSEAEEGWREMMRMQRVEVYNVPGGVAEDLEVEGRS
ncbi:hypothetical protein Tdes44962_MAKER09755 [Teratosphaeria destructans]|uniref:Uncharacterized protein n=1 Tax=Teratosphaeria destructans TaxID=418781 RepID=A0A9W7SRB2_9PEZI|nr:hypothetical protein Tdes44962_MAKER09755 [Teratosphaeria destructans]